MTAAELSPGIHHTTVSFRAPTLRDWAWPCLEVVGAQPGPRLAVYAGMHVNEVSSIEAAIRLPSALDPATLRGRISIIPVLNLPAWAGRHRHDCPIDDKNINFCFPGGPEGSFSEVLADTILTDWADDAICLVDLHGGDFGEEVARFNLVQRTGDEEFDQHQIELANLFAGDFVAQLGSEYLERPGRSVTARAIQRRHSAFAEAGVGGLIDERSVRFHLDGVLRLAAHFDLIDAAHAPALRGKKPLLLRDYVRAHSTEAGWCRMLVRPGDQVESGQVLARIVNLYGELVEEVKASDSGWIMWVDTSPVVNERQDLLGLGFGLAEGA